MKKFFEISLLFAALCTCFLFTSCSAEIPELDVITAVSSFSASYDEAAGTSRVNVTVDVENQTENVDFLACSYTIRFYDAYGNVLYTQVVSHNETLSTGEYTLISNEYVITGPVDYANAVPYSVTAAAVSEDADTSSGGCDDSNSDSGGCEDSFGNILLIIGGIYLVYKLFLSDD